ncbi:MAG: transposase [Elusimicrobia bacterium]|nr:transposase [Elusimicrobiota bacterium]
MPRIARIIAEGLPHHITQRGNNKQIVFSDDVDRKYYLSLMEEYSRKNSLSVLSYCLMNNHVHFIAVPKNENALPKIFNSVNTRYAQYYNKKKNASGHLWQGRYYSCILDNNHLLAAVRYIERNPVRAGLVAKPWLWEWSSCASNTGFRRPLFFLDNVLDMLGMNKDKWKAFVDLQDDHKFVSSIRESYKTGRPLGSEAFVSRLEKKFGRKLKSKGRGRPSK